MPSRRDLLVDSARLAAGAGVGSLFPPSIQRALSIPAIRRAGSVQDVRHVVILMMEAATGTILCC
jgi:phospholipase C